MRPPDSSEAGPRHRDRPTAENAAAANKLQVHPESTTDCRQVLRGALDRRRDAAWRLPPVLAEVGGLAARDPWAKPPGTGPSTYGLSDVELRREAARLRGDGWAAWEVRRGPGVSSGDVVSAERVARLPTAPLGERLTDAGNARVRGDHATAPLAYWLRDTP